MDSSDRGDPMNTEASPARAIASQIRSLDALFERQNDALGDLIKSPEGKYEDIADEDDDLREELADLARSEAILRRQLATLHTENIPQTKVLALVEDRKPVSLSHDSSDMPSKEQREDALKFKADFPCLSPPSDTHNLDCDLNRTPRKSNQKGLSSGPVGLPEGPPWLSDENMGRGARNESSDESVLFSRQDPTGLAVCEEDARPRARSRLPSLGEDGVQPRPTLAEMLIQTFSARLDQMSPIAARSIGNGKVTNPKETPPIHSSTSLCQSRQSPIRKVDSPDTKISSSPGTSGHMRSPSLGDWPLSLMPPRASLNDTADNSSDIIGTNFLSIDDESFPEFDFHGHMLPDQVNAPAARRVPVEAANQASYEASIMSSSCHSYITAADEVSKLGVPAPPEPDNEGNESFDDRTTSSRSTHSQTRILVPVAKFFRERWLCLLLAVFLGVFVGSVVSVSLAVARTDNTVSGAPTNSGMFESTPVPMPPYPPSFSPMVPSPTTPESPGLEAPANETLVPITDPELFSFLLSSSPDGGMALQDSASPQFLAYSWLANDIEIDNYPDQRTIQRYALATLYYSTNGDGWSRNDAWLSDQHECLWFSMSTTGACDADGRLVRLELHSNNLTGNVPAEISLLSSLVSLDLSGGLSNWLTGAVPEELWLLTNLRGLSLANNKLEGSLPSNIGSLRLIENMDLSNNRFTGFLPASITELSFLEYLNLSRNVFEGELPKSVGSLASLVVLRLDNNFFNGKVPSSIGDLGSLTILNLNRNLFIEIPTTLGRLASLQRLYLMNNIIEGNLVTELGELKELSSLSLSNNVFRSTIPTELGRLSKLRHLDLSNNRFGGNIPHEIGWIGDALRSLELNNNLLSGTVPLLFERLSQLSLLFLHSNFLTGSMPSQVCRVFNETLATISIDCDSVDCPCCNFCCGAERGCMCRYLDTEMDWRCF